MIIESIIPSGNGGINGEGRTLKEICEKPVPDHLIKKLDEERLAPEVVSSMKADLARMGSSRVPQPAQDGHVDFSVIARIPQSFFFVNMIGEDKFNIESLSRTLSQKLTILSESIS